MTRQNKAAYIDGKHQNLYIKEVPYCSPGPDEVSIRVHAAAANPADNVLWTTGLFINQWPHVLGCDAAGVVEEVGEGVSHVKPTDRVFSICSAEAGKAGFGDTKGFGGFQQYTLARAKFVGKLPDQVSFEDGCVFAVTSMTATICLFAKDPTRKFLALDPPSLKPSQKEEYVLVWGGSSSVGSCTIQLAVCAGYKVITTCSKHNFQYCESFGVEKAFDHRDSESVNQILEFLKDKSFIGTVDTISQPGTVKSCVRIAQEYAKPVKTIFVSPAIAKDLPDDISTDICFGDIGTETKNLIKYIHTEFLPQALQVGSFRAGRPQPEVVGHGLEFAQKSLEMLSAGVSGKKLVITL